MTRNIFISYRRDDASREAASMQDGLRLRLPQASVFRDGDSIPPGADFERHIRTVLEGCDLVLVLIGDRWLARGADGRRRIDQPGDVVRAEISAALRLGGSVVPVLIHGASMPSPGDLPADICGLARLNAYALDDQHWSQGLDDLARAMPDRRALASAAPAPAPAPRSLPGTPATSTPLRGSLRFRVPGPAHHFTGRRAELDEVTAAIRGEHGRLRLVSIVGLGGVGKSQIALKWLEEHESEFAVVAWIRAEDGGMADLADLAKQLGEPTEGRPLKVCADMALRWLSESRDPWLLVLDNVETVAQLEECCPPSGCGRVLLTSRDLALSQASEVVQVSVLDEASAVDFLVALARRPADREAAAVLAADLGHLPLALSHAGAYCAQGTSFRDYREMLGELPASELFETTPERSFAQTVASTWQVSIGAAERDEPLAPTVLAIAAHLAADAIPKSVFRVVLVADGSIRKVKDLHDAFNALSRMSLIRVDDDSISVHRLVQKVVREDAARRADWESARSALVAIARSFPPTSRCRRAGRPAASCYRTRWPSRASSRTRATWRASSSGYSTAAPCT